MGNTIPTYKDPYEEKLKGYLQQMEERKPFQYDVGSDALYQQLLDNYEQQGKLAMEDTMGKAAAMTGGYGNSYAHRVGQQVYNQHMQQLNDMVPDIYGMALDRYQQEGKDQQDKYDFYKGLSDESYNKYLMENGLLSGNNGSTPKYTELVYGSDAHKRMEREIAEAKSLDALKSLVKQYIAWGFDPELINELTAARFADLTPKTHITHVHGGNYISTPQ